MSRLELIKLHIDQFKAITDDIEHLKVIGDTDNIQKRISDLKEVKKSLDRDFNVIDMHYRVVMHCHKG